MDNIKENYNVEAKAVITTEELNDNSSLKVELWVGADITERTSYNRQGIDKVEVYQEEFHSLFLYITEYDKDDESKEIRQTICKIPVGVVEHLIAYVNAAKKRQT